MRSCHHSVFPAGLILALLPRLRDTSVVRHPGSLPPGTLVLECRHRPAGMASLRSSASADGTVAATASSLKNMDSVLYAFREFAQTRDRPNLITRMRPHKAQSGRRSALGEFRTRIWRSAARLARPDQRPQNSVAALTISPYARANAEGDQLVILDIASGRIYRSNVTGMLVWRAFEANHSLEAIAEEVSSRCGIPPAQVVYFVRRLRDLGLVVQSAR
jgi:hypothetical protein